MDWLDWVLIAIALDQMEPMFMEEDLSSGFGIQLDKDSTKSIEIIDTKIELIKERIATILGVFDDDSEVDENGKKKEE